MIQLIDKFEYEHLKAFSNCLLGSEVVKTRYQRFQIFQIECKLLDLRYHSMIPRIHHKKDTLVNPHLFLLLTLDLSTMPSVHPLWSTSLHFSSYGVIRFLGHLVSQFSKMNSNSVMDLQTYRCTDSFCESA